MKKKLLWYKNYGQPGLNIATDEQIGAAYRAIQKYFDSGGEDNSAGILLTDPVARMLYETMKAGVDESLEEYRQRVADGRKGSRTRWKRTAEQAETEEPDTTEERRRREVLSVWDRIGNIPP